MEIQVDNFPYFKIGTSTSPVGMSSPAYHNLFFYSAPSSPAGETSSESIPLFRYQEANYSNDHDFEFDSSPSFNQLSQQDSFSLGRTPTIAFADEIFRDGKVMPIASPQSPPLKLPPRLLRKRNHKPSGQEGTVASSPSNKVGCRKLWNDDFDPFMAALENVMEVKKVKASANSPSSEDSKMKGQIVPKTKGFEFAREVRIIQIGQMGKLDKLLKKLISERDQKPESMTKKTPTLLRKLSFKSASRGKLATLKEENRVSHHPRARSHELSKMVLMHYNPRGIPCMGYN